ncbi:MAG TPA: cupin domain-containing protein [Longimicrobiaceae bacterium]|nr:cupin domain-containing protein [Longimicrobiaceae bacterium]
MPSISRPLADDVLRVVLEDESTRLIESDALVRGGRSARTLVKDGPLRVALTALGAGGHLAPHRALGPITVHVLSGSIRFRAKGDEWVLEPGELLSLGAGVEHEVISESGAVFLLTVAIAPAGREPSVQADEAA